MFRTALVTAALAICLPALGLAQTVDELVDRNVAARGGAEAFRAVSALRLTGRMDVGRGTLVPYVLEQKRPNKMRLEFVFNGQTTVQSSDGKTGWKLVPFRGKATPEPLTETEMREAADSADPYGLLFDYAKRGLVLELLGSEAVEGRDAFKLKVTLPGGAVRWVFLDAESGIEIKVDAVRTLGGREQHIETFYRDWKPVHGLLMPHRHETRVQGAKDSHLLTVDTVVVNPALAESRFAMPAEPPASAELRR